MAARQPVKALSVLAALRRHGILLESDPRLPSVVSLVAGRPIRGSWWGHPSGGAIYRVAGELGHHNDVTLVKLVAGKVTFVHRRFWPHLVAIGTAREPWQLAGLSGPARALLQRVKATKLVRTDDPTISTLVRPAKPAAAALELERRLLIAGWQTHTESGAHAKCLQPWEEWARQAKVVDRIPVKQAKTELDQAVRAMNQQFGANGRLPWWSASTV